MMVSKNLYPISKLQLSDPTVFCGVTIKKSKNKRSLHLEHM